MTPADLEGFDAVVHLAALSDDPVGDLEAEQTEDTNHRASIRLAESACGTADRPAGITTRWHAGVDRGPAQASGGATTDIV